MALSQDEIQKVNDLYKQLDQKDSVISSLKSEINTATQTINLLNATIESNKTLLGEVNSKIDTVIGLVKKTPAKK